MNNNLTLKMRNIFSIIVLCADQKGKSDLYKNSYNVMTLYKCGYHFGTGLLQSVN